MSRAVRRGLAAALLLAAAACLAADDPMHPVVADNGSVLRKLDLSGGRVRGHSYALGDCAFMDPGSPEFSFLVDGRRYSGLDAWTGVAVTRDEPEEGVLDVRVAFAAPDGAFAVSLGYRSYRGLDVVRKTLTVENTAERDLRLEAVSVEDFSAPLDPTPSQTYRWYGRYPVQGAFVGDWNDALVVVHDPTSRRGLAVGNETPGVLKRTETFADGRGIRSGVTAPGQPYPFRRWLRKGERWTSAATFTAPYRDCGDPRRVVDTAVQRYVRRHLGARVERIAHKPEFVYNTWYPFRTAVDERTVRELAAAAAECGVGEFVIDDGWQANSAPFTGTHGDWETDRTKFPDGLKGVFDYVKSLGMKPGLWISIAAVDATSRVFAEHPEYMLRDAKGGFPDIHNPRPMWRNACLGTGWCDFIRDRILAHVRESGLAYVKLDLAVATSAYMPDVLNAGCAAADHPFHRDREESFDAIYRRCLGLFDELHGAAPDLFIDCTFETCGKLHLMDYGFARHADGNWLANVEDPCPTGSLRVRQLAWERTPALPPASLVIGNQRLDDPERLLAFKSLAGTLPILLGDPRRLTRAERAELRAWADWLRALERRHGFLSFRQDLAGFGAPAEGSWDGFQRINVDTAGGGLVGVFRQGAAESSRAVAVTGLDPVRRYAVRRGPDGARVASATGAELAAAGFRVSFARPYDGELFEVVAETEGAVIAAEPLANADVLEPSVQNEVDRALSVAPADPPPAAVLPFATNGLSRTDIAIRLVSGQRADGRWFVGTNDVTAAAVEILRGL